MRTQYTARLRCATCGNDSDFEYNEDQSYIRCNLCNREYLGGYDELVSLNTEVKQQIESEIRKETKKELENMLKRAFGRSKNITIK
jgi:DNA-directed RNA polymerase subunit RPC12/RpoP